MHHITSIFRKFRHPSITGIAGILALLHIYQLVTADDSLVTDKPLPKLQHLSTSEKAIQDDRMQIITLDSAVLQSPEKRQNLTGTSVAINVLPKCLADSVTLFVRHSAKVDTLARLTSPPFRYDWDFSSIPDQDQIHLQFGYILHTPNGKTITSKALPHNWVLDRSKRFRRKKYHSRQTLTPDTIIIDGKLDEWSKFRRAHLGTSGTFALTWTNAALYFAAWIHTPSVSSGDFVELHLDPFHTRTSLSDSRHRSIRFSPTSRSYCFVAIPGPDSTMYIQSDSIAVLLGEGMVWRTVVSDTGYTIEAKIPFYALSDLDFPSMRSGLSVSCLNSEAPAGQQFLNWPGTGEFTRYNPSEWGVLILHQAMLPLKITLLAGAILLGFFCLVVVIKITYHFIHSEKLESKEYKGGSELLRRIQEYVEDNITDTNLSAESIAESLQMNAEDVAAVLKEELDCSFNLFIDTRRIARAKSGLWNFGLPLETVASLAGFKSVPEMEKTFEQYLHTDPEKYRRQAEEMSADDSEDSSEKDLQGEDLQTLQTDIPS